MAAAVFCCSDCMSDSLSDNMSDSLHLFEQRLGGVLDGRGSLLL